MALHEHEVDVVTPKPTPTPSTFEALQAPCGMTATDEPRGTTATEPPILRDGSRRRALAQMTVLTVLGMAYQVGLGMCMPLYATYAAHIGLGEAAGGLIIAVPSIARVLLNLCIGDLCDRFGRKPLLIGGSLIKAVGMYCTASASGLCVMIVGRLLVGAGGAATDISAQACRLDIVAQFPTQRGAILGWAQALTVLAYAAGPVMGGRVAAQAGVRLPFYAFAHILLVSAPLYALLPESRRKASTLPSARQDGDGTEGPVCELAHEGAKAEARRGEAPSCPLKALGGGTPGLVELARDPRQRALLLLRFALTAGWAAWMTLVPLHLSRRFGMSTEDIGFYLSALTLLGFASSPVGGALADRVGHSLMARSGAAASAGALGLLSGAFSLPQFWALLAVWEFGISATNAAQSAAAAEWTRLELRGTQSSLLGQVGDGTFVLLPTALGVVAAKAGTSCALLLSAALQLAAVSLAARILRLSRASARAQESAHSL